MRKKRKADMDTLNAGIDRVLGYGTGPKPEPPKQCNKRSDAICSPRKPKPSPKPAEPNTLN